MEALSSFGIQGPKGDTGAQGPRGIQGPQGPAGTSGLTSLELITNINANTGVKRYDVKYIFWIPRYSSTNVSEKLQSRGQTLYFINDNWATSGASSCIIFTLSSSGYFSTSQNGSNNSYYGCGLFFS